MPWHGPLRGPWWSGSVSQQFFISIAGLQEGIPKGEQWPCWGCQASNVCRQRQPAPVPVLSWVFCRDEVCWFKGFSSESV